MLRKLTSTIYMNVNVIESSEIHTCLISKMKKDQETYKLN